MVLENIKKISENYPAITAGSLSLIIGFFIGYVLHENFPERFEPVVINQEEVTVEMVK